MKFKRCFKGNHVLPLFMFQDNKAKHKVASDLGKCVNCRICTIKQHFKFGGTFTMSEGFIKRNKLRIIIEALRK